MEFIVMRLTANDGVEDQTNATTTLIVDNVARPLRVLYFK